MKTKLQEIRKMRGFKSAKSAADAIGLPVPTYTNYEQGVRDMSISVAWELADFFDVSLDDLAGRRFGRKKQEIEYSVADMSLNDEGNEKLREFAEFLKTNPDNTKRSGGAAWSA